MAQSFSDDIEAWFQLKDRKSTLATEVRAAMATFLTMCYILLVNPQLLSHLGISPTCVVVGTALASAIGSIFAGVFANLPLGLAPGVGLSAYLTYGLVLGEGLTVKEAFTTCFVASLILLLCSVTGLSQVIMTVIPRSVKLATIVGMGMQIALVGMTSVHLVVPNSQTIVGLGDLSNYQIWLSLAGLVLIGSLLYHEVPGAILVGILLVTALTWHIEDSWPTSYVQVPSFDIDSASFVDLGGFDYAKCSAGIAAFLFIGIIDVSGVVFGMASLADIEAEGGKVPGATAAFVAVSLGSLVSALTGGTPVIVYVESAAGIKEGGRTGLTAVIVGLLFLLSLFFAPCLAKIPLTATSPVAILIGAMMMGVAKEIDWNNMSEAIPAFLTAIIMPFTFSISNGIVFGLLTASCFYVTTGQFYLDALSLCGGSVGAGTSEAEMTPLNARRDSQSEQHNRERGNSFLDHSPFVRTPSLLLSKQRADEMDQRQRSHGHSHDHGHNHQQDNRQQAQLADPHRGQLSYC